MKVSVGVVMSWNYDNTSKKMILVVVLVQK